jgi:hypothetical protein
MYRLSYVKYCQFIILSFIASMLWVMELGPMGVRLNNDILPPLSRLVGRAIAGTQK